MTQNTTDNQFKEVIDACKGIFLEKTADYGTSWRVYRMITVADQLYIKAKRIRNIQEKVVQLIDDSIENEFKAIVNYSIIGLIQMQITHDEWDLPVEEVEKLYDKSVNDAMDLLSKKNHDYGEAWRDMDQRGLTDLILAKILRIRQILKNDGKTIISEGVDSNLYDILIYAVFALILMNNPK
ncbi:MAG: DUF1599 domain-containing protein [Chitinophagaceae bacterium]|nr:DUF1599 domain-containing protein [Chitinophagaceae bacterium]